MRGVVNNLASSDPNAALSMMDRFPNASTTMWSQQFAWHSFRNDPSIAVNQIARIADEGERNQMYAACRLHG